MNAPVTQVTKSTEEQIDYIEEIANNPNLNTGDLNVVFGVSDGVTFDDT